MIKYSDYKNLADRYLHDAQKLFDSRSYSGAYYITGYSIECALKACIAKKTKKNQYPLRDGKDYYTHDLEKLFKLAELWPSFEILVEPKKKDKTYNADLSSSWLVVKDWNAESRYEKHNKVKAKDMIDATEDTGHGVLTWIKQCY